MIFDPGQKAVDFAMTAIDFETTGRVKGYEDEAWQIGWIELCRGKIDEGSQFDRLLGVGDRPFNRYAPGRHAQVREELRQLPPLQAYWQEIRGHLEGKILCAHNAGTEKRIFNKYFPLNDFGPWIDTLKLSRILFEDLEDYSLESVIGHLGAVNRLREIVSGRDWHDALFDAAGSALVIEYVLTEFPDIPLANLIDPDMGDYYRRRRF